MSKMNYERQKKIDGIVNKYKELYKDADREEKHNLKEHFNSLKLPEVEKNRMWERISIFW